MSDRLRQMVDALKRGEHTVFSLNDLDDLAKEIAALRAEVERLTAAISRHRSAVWGDGEVEHPEDNELYAALRDAAKGGGR